MKREDIVNKHFPRAILGYDIGEVDAFLDQIVLELDKRDKEHETDLARVRALAIELKKRGAAGG